MKKPNEKNIAIIIVLAVPIIYVLVNLYLDFTRYNRMMKEVLKKQKEHPEQRVFDGEVEPPMPNREENDKTILGIDSNKNGIRDDVDIWINRTALDYNERMAMRQYARAEQNKLRTCSFNLGSEVSNAFSESSTAYSCLTAISDPLHADDYAHKSINILTVSTNSRKDCYDFYNKNLVTFQAKESEPHLNCNFIIQNLQQVISRYHKFWGYLK